MPDILQRIRQFLSEKNIDALLLSNTHNIFYTTGFDGFSTEEREGYALVTTDAVYLFTDARLLDAIPSAANINPVEISAKSPFKKQLIHICEKHKATSVGFEPHSLTAEEFIALNKLSEIKLIPTDPEHFREIKSSKEIDSIKKACYLGDRAFKHILTYIKSGLSEKEIAAEITIFFIKNLATNSFPPIVAFGDHSAIPHHSPTDRILEKKDIIKLDFGCKFNNYCSDMTRTIFIGKPTKEQKHVYETVRAAQEKSFAYLQSNKIKIGHDADNVARTHIISKKYPSIPHSVGHGIGLAVHEAPKLSPNTNQILTNGMVFSIEPGIYLPGKFGVRVEDIVALQDGKVTFLTKSTRELIVL